MNDIAKANQNFTPNSAASLSSGPEAETNRFMQKVYGWMAFALLISGGVAYYVSTDSNLLKMILDSGLFTPLLFLELGLVIGLSWLIKKMNATTAIVLFIAYSFLTGLTLSVIFLVYELGSIVSIFGVTALIFAAMSLYGYTTQKDLTGIGTMAIFGLFGIVIASIVNLFLGNTMVDTVISAIGVIVFIALTAYDTQKIRTMNVIGNEGTDDDKKEAIMGALTLYLDFINLFLDLLSLFGKKK